MRAGRAQSVTRSKLKQKTKDERRKQSDSHLVNIAKEPREFPSDKDNELNRNRMVGVYFSSAGGKGREGR